MSQRLYPSCHILSCQPVALPADLRLGRGHIAALHLKETRPGVFREIPYGEGHVDFAGAIDAAWALGVRRYVTEFWYDKTLPDWRAELRKARSRFTVLLDQKE